MKKYGAPRPKTARNDEKSRFWRLIWWNRDILLSQSEAEKINKAIKPIFKIRLLYMNDPKNAIIIIIIFLWFSHACPMILRIDIVSLGTC